MWNGLASDGFPDYFGARGPTLKAVAVSFREGTFVFGYTPQNQICLRCLEKENIFSQMAG